MVAALIRIAPLLPLLRGQRDRRVAHADHQIDKRHAGERGTEEIRRVVHNITHKQPARRAPLAGEQAGGRDALGDEGLGAVHEVEERVPLREILALRLIPVVMSHLASTAHVGKGKHYAAIDQRKVGQRLGRKTRVDADPIGTIPIQVQRSGSRLATGGGRGVAAVHSVRAPQQRHRHLLAVACRHGQLHGPVLARVEIGHRPLLEELGRSGRTRGHLKLKQRVGRDHRCVRDAQLALRIEQAMACDVRLARLHLKGHRLRVGRGRTGACVERADPDLGEPARAA